MDEYKNELLSRKRALILNKNIYNEKIKENKNSSIEAQGLYMNNMGFGLFKKKDNFTKNILYFIYYKLLRKKIEKNYLI